MVEVALDNHLGRDHPGLVALPRLIKYFSIHRLVILWGHKSILSCRPHFSDAASGRWSTTRKKRRDGNDERKAQKMVALHVGAPVGNLTNERDFPVPVERRSMY